MIIKFKKEFTSENLKTRSFFKFFRRELSLWDNSGFTLVEALVAISILMIAIASPMALSQKGLYTASLSKDQMIATFLAQDAVESVKNIRDQIAITQTTGDWLDNPLLGGCICNKISDAYCNFDGPTSSLIFCTIDSASTDWKYDATLTSISKGFEATAKLNSIFNIDSNGIKSFLKYGHVPAIVNPQPPLCPSVSSAGNCREVTKFTRYMNIKKTGNLGGNEAVVNVRVSWPSASGEIQKIDVNDYIYNYSEFL